MADTASVHVGDIGTTFWILLKEGTTELDPELATAAYLFIQRKAKTDILQVEPVVATDPLDNKKKFKYVTVIGDLNVAGTYTLQLYAETADGKWHTTTFEFTVAANLRDTPLP